MRSFIQVVLISIAVIASFGCSAEATAKDAVQPIARVRVIPSRTLLKVMLIDGLNSDTSSAGDTFLASLAEPIVINGFTVLEKGTIVSGIVFNSLESGDTTGNASIGFALTGIQQGDQLIAIKTNSFSAASAVNRKRDAEVVAGGAGLGGTGSGFAFSARGKEIHYDPETLLNFTLTTPVHL